MYMYVCMYMYEIQCTVYACDVYERNVCDYVYVWMCMGMAREIRNGMNGCMSARLIGGLKASEGMCVNACSRAYVSECVLWLEVDYRGA